MGRSTHDGTPCYEQLAFLERRVQQLEDEAEHLAETLKQISKRRWEKGYRLADIAKESLRLRNLKFDAGE